MRIHSTPTRAFTLALAPTLAVPEVDAFVATANNLGIPPSNDYNAGPLAGAGPTQVTHAHAHAHIHTHTRLALAERWTIFCCLH